MMVNIDIARNLIENAHYVENGTNENKEDNTMNKAVIETIWDGDTYSYIVKAGDKRIETTYDYHDAVEIADTYNAAQEDIDTAIECGLIEAKKEEITMTQSTFTTKLGNTFSTNDKGNYFYMTSANGKKYRIKKSEYEQAKREYELECRKDADEKIGLGDDEHEGLFDDLRTPEQEEEAMKEAEEWLAREDAKRGRGVAEEDQTDEEWEAEADAERKAREDKMAADAKATEDAVNGLEHLSEDEKATIEPAEAELLNNIRKEKKAKEGAKKAARKPRKSKDIAYDDHGVTLTAKQVDFIRHLPDTCFWEAGVDSTVWVDVLCDEIGGQFAEKPMTVGAMISTLCEKKLGIRATEKREGRKCTSFSLTDLGAKVAKELGLE